MPPSTIDQSGQVVHGDQTNIAGNVYTGNVYTGDQAYDVRGLTNPYLGLKAFTYTERERYAGREPEVERALALLTTPGHERSLLFITGASGSGKSSFVQAGLLPVLEQHYQQSNPVAWASFRPGAKPLAALAVALRTLKLPATGLFAPVAPYQITQPLTPAPTNQISLLLIDQFEELFSQAIATEREAIFTLLASLPAFRDLPMHIVITLRADYLPDLFAHPALYDQAKAGIDLRAMDANQLALAIQRPLQVFHPQAGKRFQTALLNRLATDAAEDAAYLPLLQVTLEELWQGGFLTIDYYTSLTSAISQRADAILAFTNDAAGNPTVRSPQQQTTLLQLFLDLVDVSPDGDQRRDVRRTQRLADLTRGQATTENLIRELATARLLSTGEKLLDTHGQPTQTVDIIHESLIHNWPRLQQAIQADREHLQQRRRFELRLDEWRSHDQSNDFLLTGVYLVEAEQLQQSDDVALQSPAAKSYLAKSIGQRNRLQQAEIERQRVELERQHILATEQARRSEAETKRATAEANRARTFRRATVIASTLLVIAILLGFIAYNRQQVAEARAQEARARALVAQAGALQQQPNLLPISMLLAIEAQQTKPSSEAEDLMRQGLTLLPKVNFAVSAPAKVTQVAFSADGAWVATADESGLVQIRTTVTSALVRSIQPGQAVQQNAVVRDLAFSPANSNWLATADNAHQACLWDVTTGQPIFPCITHTERVNKVRFSPDGQWLATASLDGKACLWVAATGQPNRCLILGHEVQALAFSPNQPWLAAADDNGNVQLWDIVAAKQLASMNQHTPVLALAFSHDGKLATAGMMLLPISGQLTRLRPPCANFPVSATMAR